MKALIYTGLILGLAFLAYDFFGAPRSQRIVFERAPEAVVGQSEGRVAVEQKGSIAKSMGVGPTMGNESAQHADASSFVPPPIESLEELTKNWTVIPSSAFPREVKLSRDVEFKMSAGSSRLAAGGRATALGCEKGILMLAPAPTSTARGYARVDETNLKEQFAEPYRKWVAWRKENLRQRWESQRGGKAKALTILSQEKAVDGSGKPVRSEDGSYPVLLASMSAGEVTDITPKKVKHLGQPQLVTTEGRPTWVIDVHYDTVVFCGPIEAHAQAHIRDGKVIRWVYPGSGEPVP